MDVEFPSRIRTVVDGCSEVHGGVIPVELGGVSFVVDALDSLEGLPGVSDEGRLVHLVDPDEGVDSRSVHVSIRAGDAQVVQEEREHVCGFGDEAEVVPHSPPFRNSGCGVGFESMDEFRETDSVSNEENGEVDADEIVVSFFGVKFYSESSRISEVFGRLLTVNHGGESNGDGG